MEMVRVTHETMTQYGQTMVKIVEAIKEMQETGEAGPDSSEEVINHTNKDRNRIVDSLIEAVPDKKMLVFCLMSAIDAGEENTERVISEANKVVKALATALGYGEDEHIKFIANAQAIGGFEDIERLRKMHG